MSILELAKRYGVEDKLLRFSIGSSAEIKKKILLAMPKGCERPAERSSLGRSLYNYTSNKSFSYDSAFNKAIIERQPQWFINTNTATENKKALLAMPKGTERLTTKHPFGIPLRCYTKKTHNSYDIAFNKIIRKKQPQWFTGTTTKKKKAFLAMPKGCKKPVGDRHPLGNSLYWYTKPKNISYDPEFDRAIRKKQPQWFVNTATENKKALLAMPIGSIRPNKRKSPLGKALSRYRCPNHHCYDPIFAKAIFKKQPQWFQRSLL